MRHEEDRPRADVNRAVDGGETGDEDKGVDQMHAAFPSGGLDGDGHWGFQGSGFAIGERVGVPGAGEAEEQCGTHVDENDAPEDLSDGARHRDPRILGLGCSDGNGLAASVEGGTEDENGSYASKPVRKCTWVMPVSEANGIVTRNSPGDIDNAEEKVCRQSQQFYQSEPKLGFPKGSDSKKLEAQECEPKNQKVAPERNFIGPEDEDGRQHIIFVGQNGDPDDKIIPTHCASKGRVDEAIGQGGKGTTARI